MYRIKCGRQKKFFIKCIRHSVRENHLPRKYILKYYKIKATCIAKNIKDELIDAAHEVRTLPKTSLAVISAGVVVTALTLNVCVLNTRIDELHYEKKQIVNELENTREEYESSIDALKGVLDTERVESASKDTIIAEKDNIIDRQQNEIEGIESEKEDIIKNFTEQIDSIDFTSGASSRSSSELNSAADNIAEVEMLIRDALGYTEDANALVARLDAKITELQDIADRIPDYYPTIGVLSSKFGYRRDPITGETRYHKGQDISNSTGTAIWASAKGTVIYAGESSGYGLNVVINHGGNLSTRYAHLSKIEVSVGDNVEKGEEIALMGATGRVTGPHLHFEVLIDDVQVDPMDYIG